ncbi:unnamed protein product [Ceutorhynchus assimilis]|uniref:BESS domain-containing protein n=1 Tax=Ceutorhynchus assimilis TaxID=467358 RepID=A0A9N9MBA9_9CUCU|nr:unnamed protein product [Ceutorhynchus assimilis]
MEERDNTDTDYDVSTQDTELDSDTLANDNSIHAPSSSKTEHLEAENKKHSSETINKHKTAIKRKLDSGSCNEEKLKIERQKVQYLQEKANRRSREVEKDDNSSFFKSLLPHVRKIPPNKILSFRGRIQQMVDEYAYGHGPMYHGPYVTTPQISPYSGIAEGSAYSSSSSSLYSASAPSTYGHVLYNTTTQENTSLAEPESPQDLLSI